jgi:catechol 2,3-dioxygenase
LGSRTNWSTAPEVRVSGQDRITYGPVHLNVTDPRGSLEFWRDLIGMQAIDTDDDGIALGSGGQALLVLHPGAQRGVGRAEAALYHLAIHLPDPGEFARALARLIVARVPQSPTDHIFSQATSLHDPDGIMLELTLETPERFRSLEIGRDEVVMFDSHGRRRGPTEALDVEAALSHLGDRDPFAALPAGVVVGHVHLHVPDLPAAFAFYRDVVGFDEHAYMVPYGMADLSAGGAFPHRIALNNWHGLGARQPRPGTAGLRHFELVLREPGADLGLAARASAAGTPAERAESGRLVLRDPAGNRIVIRSAVLPSESWMT